MGTALDPAGQCFGSWLVLERAESDHHRRAVWLCRCDCGKKKAVFDPLAHVDTTNTEIDLSLYWIIPDTDPDGS